ncbi:MAG: flagellar protein FlaG [Deltaproteobacteria bacterium]|nr:flagellar protein FlaG [Deltaproteobacteria bacterium]
MKIHLSQDAISHVKTYAEAGWVHVAVKKGKDVPAGNTELPPVQPSPEPKNNLAEINNLNVKLHFSVDEGTGKAVVEIMDAETGQVVRQVPPEELLRVIEVLRDLKGSLISRRL